MDYNVKFDEDRLIHYVRSVGDSQSYMVVFDGTEGYSDRDRRYVRIAKETIKYTSWVQKRATTTWKVNDPVLKDALQVKSRGVYSAETMKLHDKLLFIPSGYYGKDDEDKRSVSQYKRDYKTKHKPQEWRFIDHLEAAHSLGWEEKAPWMIRFLADQDELDHGYSRLGTGAVNLSFCVDSVKKHCL